MGIVYEADQLSLSRRVALKVLPLASLLSEKQLLRFINEARAAASLKHPNIVGVHGVGCERSVHFYAMELIDGADLAQIISEVCRSNIFSRAVYHDILEFSARVLVTDAIEFENRPKGSIFLGTSTAGPATFLFDRGCTFFHAVAKQIVNRSALNAKTL